jgi:hypothetical protein
MFLMLGLAEVTPSKLLEHANSVLALLMILWRDRWRYFLVIAVSLSKRDRF